MSNYEATRYTFSGANLSGVQGVNTGIIVPWSSAAIPSGFLECNGALVSRTTYADLFAVVGTTYGAGDGSSTFKLPDLQNNIIIGKSNNKALASTGGSENISANVVFDSLTTENATLSTAQLASHSHPGTVAGGSSPGPGKIAISSAPGTFGVADPAFATASIGTAGSGSGHSHNIAITNTAANVVGSVLQPYVVTLYIIKT